MAEKRRLALKFAEGRLEINLILKFILQLLMSLTKIPKYLNMLKYS